jgi:predicted ribosome quality control (RQC) complex YloA/Tae2 family protein
VLSLAELRRAARLVERELGEARLRRSVQVGRFELVLVFERGGRGARRRLACLLSCEPRFARLSLLPEAPPAPPSSAALPAFLRAHAHAARVAGLEVAAGDRVARLRLAGGAGTLTLVLALMGARSNLYLVDSEDRLRLALRPLEETRRDLALGGPWRDLEGPARPEGEDRFARVADAELFAALEAGVGEARRAEGERERLALLRRALRRRLETLERKRELLEGDLAAGARAGELERVGELLKANLHRVRRGASELALEEAAGAAACIPLDPALSPAENLEALFRRYRKELKRAARAGEELAAADEALERARRLAAELEALASAGRPGALAAFAERPEVTRLLARARPAARPPGAAPARRPRPSGVPARLLPRRYRSTGGLEIWVGRSDEGNDLLSTRLARGNDLFFHLEGSPGSHVVLRTEGRPDPPAEAVLEACELAVHFSKQRGASRAGVHVVPIKQVRKPRGAKPGLVVVHGGRTVSLRCDPARLRRVLEGRMGEEE